MLLKKQLRLLANKRGSPSVIPSVEKIRLDRETSSLVSFDR